jgi:hypothetical protein
MYSSQRLLGVCIVIAMAQIPAAPASSQEYQFPADDIPGMKSPGMATALSLVGTIVPIGASFALGEGQEGLAAGLFLGGLLAGPSLGYLYAGETGSAFKTIGLRTAVLGATIGLAAAACSAGCDIFGPDDDGWAAAGLIALGGTAVTAFLAGRDIARADNAVRARNERVARSAVSIGLQYVPEARAPGLVLTLRR